MMERLALSYLRRAESRLIVARTALKRRSHPDAVRYSQEAVEMALKGVLRAVGIEYPRSHEVSTILFAERQRLPSEVSEKLEELARISSELYDARGPAMYGDEESGTPPEEIFSQDDAARFVQDAESVIKVCRSAFAGLGTEPEGERRP